MATITTDSAERISSVLAGEAPTTTLSADEKAVWVEQFIAKLDQAGPGEEAFFARLRASGEAVGLDVDGNLVTANFFSKGGVNE